MLDSIQSLLDAFPEGVVQLREGLVLAANEKARQYLPQLTSGSPLPVSISLPGPGEAETGGFVFGSTSYAYSCKAGPEEDVLLFRPEPRSALEGWQLEGALQQLRSLLGEILAEAAPAATPERGADGSFSKTFHRLFRLIDNLEFMQQAAEEDGVSFHPATLDLDGLCRELAVQAGGLLREAGTTLEYRFQGRGLGLLIPGDSRLLRKMLLELISNAARAAGEGCVSLSLRRSGEYAVILLSNTVADSNRQQLSALLHGGPSKGLPQPGQGAGLGLPIAQRIVQLHGGKLLPYGGGANPGVLIRLPTGPLDGRTILRTPCVQWDGGLDPVLVELSDVLPAKLFGMEGLD